MIVAYRTNSIKIPKTTIYVHHTYTYKHTVHKTSQYREKQLTYSKIVITSMRNSIWCMVSVVTCLCLLVCVFVCVCVCLCLVVV